MADILEEIVSLLVDEKIKSLHVALHQVTFAGLHVVPVEGKKAPTLSSRSSFRYWEST